MSNEVVRTILANPAETIGMGNRIAQERKVSRLWPLGLGLAAMLFAGTAMGHGGDSPHKKGEMPADVAETVTRDSQAANSPETGWAEAPEASAPTSPRHFQLYYQKLGAFVSRPEETRDRFMTRVGNFLAHYTQSTGWEACGMIQEADDGKGWAVRLITNGSQIGCAQIHFDTPGYTSIDDSIHSHPAETRLNLSQQDSRLRNRGICGQRVSVSPYGFSDIDYSVGNGYLVVPKGGFRKAHLLHQTGVGTDRMVSSLRDDVIVIPDSGEYGTAVPQKDVDLINLTKVEPEEIKFGNRTCKTF